VSIGKKELAWICVLDAVLLAAIFVYSRIKGVV
jgi:hypothetical protein